MRWEEEEDDEKEVEEGEKVEDEVTRLFQSC
jgi:hypothetical protein